MIRNYFQEQESLHRDSITSIINNLEIHGLFKLELFSLKLSDRRPKLIRFNPPGAMFGTADRSLGYQVEILFTNGGIMRLHRFGIEHTHELCLIADCINGIIGNIIGMSIPALDQPDIQPPPSETSGGLTSRSIKARLLLAGVSSKSLADECGVGESTISMILSRKGTSRKIQTAIARALKLNFDDVWGTQVTPPSEIPEAARS